MTDGDGWLNQHIFNVLFDEKEWDALRYDVMFEILMAKFTQNHAILAILLGTGSAELAEASPYDKKWGIGFDAENAEANRGRWHRNLLGKALVAVRVRLGGEAAVPVPVPLAVGVPALEVAAAPAIARWRSPAKMCVHCKVQPRYRTFVFCGRTCRAEWVAKKERNSCSF